MWLGVFFLQTGVKRVFSLIEDKVANREVVPWKPVSLACLTHLA